MPKNIHPWAAFSAWSLGSLLYGLSLSEHPPWKAELLHITSSLPIPAGAVIFIAYLRGSNRGRPVILKSCFAFFISGLMYAVSGLNEILEIALSPFLAFSTMVYFTCLVFLILRNGEDIIPPSLERFRKIID